MSDRVRHRSVALHCCALGAPSLTENADQTFGSFAESPGFKGSLNPRIPSAKPFPNSGSSFGSEEEQRNHKDHQQVAGLE